MIIKRKKGIFSWYGFNTPMKDRFKSIKNAGFDATMLGWGDDMAVAELDKEQIR